MIMEIYQLRLARPNDLDQIWALVQRAVVKMNAEGNMQWNADYPLREDYADDICHGGLWCAATDSGQILGAACIDREEDPAYRGIVWTAPGPAISFHRAAVDPEVQRTGVATALLKKAMELAREAGLSSLRLDTYCENRNMRHLLGKLGFRQQGEFRLASRPLSFFVYELTL